MLYYKGLSVAKDPWPASTTWGTPQQRGSRLNVPRRLVQGLGFRDEGLGFRVGSPVAPY